MERQFKITITMPKGITIAQMSDYLIDAVTYHCENAYASKRQMGFKFGDIITVESIPIKQHVKISA